MRLMGHNVIIQCECGSLLPVKTVQRDDYDMTEVYNVVAHTCKPKDCDCKKEEKQYEQELAAWRKAESCVAYLKEKGLM